MDRISDETGGGGGLGDWEDEDRGDGGDFGGSRNDIDFLIGMEERLEERLELRDIRRSSWWAEKMIQLIKKLFRQNSDHRNHLDLDHPRPR